jgi:hypothetical protein
MGKLTDRDFAPNVDLDSLIHIVNTGDTTQSPSGSSYKTKLGDLVPIFVEDDSVIQTTGTLISFDKRKIYNTATSPGTTPITIDVTDAKLGVIQKIYHNTSSWILPPATWVIIGEGVYIPNVLNIIYAEWCGNNRVEYWITQQQ